VRGNQRIEADTVRSYMLLQPGDAFDADRLDRSLKSLYATGLFRDVRIARDGGRVVVEVAENPIVNRVPFEGNRKISDDVLRGEVQLRAAPCSPRSRRRPTASASWSCTRAAAASAPWSSRR
jgi:outer membrane protein insertion porin family